MVVAEILYVSENQCSYNNEIKRSKIHTSCNVINKVSSWQIETFEEHDTTEKHRISPEKTSKHYRKLVLILCIFFSRVEQGEDGKSGLPGRDGKPGKEVCSTLGI